MSTTMSENVSAATALETAFLRKVSGYDDKRAASILSILLEECGVGCDDKSRAEKAEVAFRLLKCPEYRDRMIPSSERDDGLPKTAALLWGTLFDGILTLPLESEEREAYTTLVGKREGPYLIGKEIQAVGEVVRSRLSNSQGMEAIDCCYQVLANASYILEYDQQELLRIVARSTGHMAEDRHLKAIGMFLWAFKSETEIKRGTFGVFTDLGRLAADWLAKVKQLKEDLEAISKRTFEVEAGFESVTFKTKNPGQIGLQEWETEMVERMREWGAELRARDAGKTVRPYHMSLVITRPDPRDETRLAYIQISV